MRRGVYTDEDTFRPPPLPCKLPRLALPRRQLMKLWLKVKFHEIASVNNYASRHECKSMLKIREAEDFAKIFRVSSPSTGTVDIYTEI